MRPNLDVVDQLTKSLRKAIEAKSGEPELSAACGDLFRSVYKAACALSGQCGQTMLDDSDRKALHRLFSASTAVLTSALHRFPSILSKVVSAIQEIHESKPSLPQEERRLCITATGGELGGYRTLYVTIGAGLITSHYIPTIVQGNYSVTGCGCGAFAESNMIMEAQYKFDGGEAQEAYNRHQLDVNRFAYLHAPFYHPILKAFADDRGKLAFPDIFKLTTALTDPWRSSSQYFGIWDKTMAEAVAAAMSGIGYVRAGCVVASNNIDEFVNYGVFVRSRETAPFEFADSFEFTRDAIISKETIAEELALIRGALVEGPDSSDMCHKLIWRNAAMALVVCEEPEASSESIRTAFNNKLAMLAESYGIIGGRAVKVMESWRN